MKRAVCAVAAAVTAAALLPAAASAAEVQIGVTTSPLISPTCPPDAQGNACTILLDQVTAYETLRDGVANPDTVKKSGVVSSFTLGLASTSLITPVIIAAKNAEYGGPPEAQLTALIPTGTPTDPTYRVAAQTAVVKLRSELGKVAEFPLLTPLPVVRGEILALTVPTWAPVLSIEQDAAKFSYAQSRVKAMTTVGKKRVSSCLTTSTVNLAQIVVGQLSGYTCVYPGNRIEYSALEITTPTGFTGNVRRRVKRSR
ncbi:MAG TPA: hypothetical protein VG293_01530 [Solirubrobacteraceae bacterium]|jgi:hypothetical protein|nr:hypothetical protein [Solirubrobacteraceae bacterium]